MVAGAASDGSSLRAMPSPKPPRVAVAPETAPAWVVEAVNAGGGHVVALEQEERAAAELERLQPPPLAA